MCAVSIGDILSPQAEQKKPFELAIDRPSPKFLGFLRKHYNLQSHVKQASHHSPSPPLFTLYLLLLKANNFVVFEQFFTTCVGMPIPSSCFPWPHPPHATLHHLTYTFHEHLPPLPPFSPSLPSPPSFISLPPNVFICLSVLQYQQLVDLPTGGIPSKRDPSYPPPWSL